MFVVLVWRDWMPFERFVEKRKRDRNWLPQLILSYFHPILPISLKTVINEKYFWKQTEKHHTKEISMGTKKKPYSQLSLLLALLELSSSSCVRDSSLQRVIISNADWWQCFVGRLEAITLMNLFYQRQKSEYTKTTFNSGHSKKGNEKEWRTEREGIKLRNLNSLWTLGCSSLISCLVFVMWRCFWPFKRT